MFESIKKRDGRVCGFDSRKITNAIAKAGEATGEFDIQVARKLTLKVLAMAEQMGLGPIPEVEEIQDIVERVLLDSPFLKSAKAYILYREQHAQIRQIATRASVKLVESYIDNADWKIKENSNMSYSLQGLNNYISSDVTSEYWLNRVYPPKVREAHKSGDIHIHDLSLLSVYCVGWDLQDLLLQGFRGVKGKVESSPPKHFRSALGQIVNFFYTLQGEAAGAQAISNFDTLLAPFVRHDKLDYEEVKQALQEFVFNINIPTRVGFQTPFTNLTMDLKVPGTLRDQPVIIGGKYSEKETYGQFQVEMDLINRAFAEVMMAGDARGRVFTFPIPTYNITKDFDWDNPNLDAIWRMTAKYGIPYFSNFINSDMSPEDARSMCCRLRLDNRELNKRGGGLFGANPLTGSIGVVTINLPRIAYEARTREDFFNRLAELVTLAKDSLVIKRKVLEAFTESNLYPYAKFYLTKIKESSGSYWKNHFSTIGIVGMNEACLNFLGVDIANGAGQAFSLEVMDFLRDTLSGIQKETKDIFNLEATPAEGTAFRLAMLDKQRYPDIICANECGDPSSFPFYTNSTQLPVNYTDDIFEALMLQDKLQTKYTGGTVFHVFLGEQVEDTEGAKALIRKIAENFHLPYFTLTPTFSICPEHGYMSGEQPVCAACGCETEVYSRVVGYLRPVTQWNDGKQAEFVMRKVFDAGVRHDIPVMATASAEDKKTYEQTLSIVQ
ncbi:MAG: ribonucleoside triphosphate reductase [Thermodesulfobacteriota bacterium]